MTTFSLSELSDRIFDALSVFSGDTLWVRAEIASVASRNGHGYFDLVEKSSSRGIVARQRATCWANIFPMLSAYFREKTGMTLQAGLQVLMEVEVTFHAVYGLSLNICNIDPTYTIGDLARQRQETIHRLQEEGVFDLQHSLTLPTLVSRVAIISAEQAAGYGDFQHQIQESGYRIICTLFPAIVQGERAEQSILQALSEISEREQDFDAVVIIRGGGATTDLSCFDSYLISAATAQFPLPVLTGIGHTRDVSILDLVAAVPLKTPTAVASFLINRFARQEERIRLLRGRLLQTAERQILMRRHRIDLVRQRLDLCSPERIYRLGYSLATINGRILRSIKDIRPYTIITTHLSDGDIDSIVTCK